MKGATVTKYDKWRSRSKFSYLCPNCDNVIQSYSDNESYALRAHGRHCKSVAFVTAAEFENGDFVVGAGIVSQKKVRIDINI